MEGGDLRARCHARLDASEEGCTHRADATRFSGTLESDLILGISHTPPSASYWDFNAF